MSEPRLRRINSGNGHSYTWNGQKIPGVTTVKGLLDKPGLVKWASNMAAETVVDEWEHLVSLPPTARADYVKKSADRRRDTAAVRGTRVHRVVEQMILGHEVPEGTPANVRRMAEHVANLYDEWDMKPLLVESPVAHSEWLYAGTLDSVVTCDRLGTVLLDTKTRDDGRSPYDDTSLQLAPYRFADTRLVEVPQTGPRGGKKPSLWEERPMVHVDRCAVISVTHDGAQLYPMRADESVFEVFLHLLEIYETWQKRTGWAFKSEPTFDPMVGDLIHPENDIDDVAVWREEA